MRVVIADDEKFVLVVLKSALRSVRFPIEIVGEALDGDDAYRLCCKKKPDLGQLKEAVRAGGYTVLSAECAEDARHAG